MLKEATMKELERAMEWLRPLVDSKAWDYCVVWKLGDDPSRFIEWMGCCCSGANGGGGAGEYKSGGKVKEEKGEDKHLGPFCRDVYVRHPVRTKACEALAQLPSFMPLYSGIHGEVVISTQPKWLIIHANALDSNPSLGSIGTRVLIPVSGGIIELFAAKNVEEDWNTIELITSQCTFGRQEAMIPQGYSNVSIKNDERFLDPHVEEKLQSLPFSCPLVPRMQVLPPLIHPDSHTGFEGSSSSSNPSNDYSLFDLHSGHISQSEHVKQLLCKCSVSRKFKSNDNSLKKQGGKYKSKNLITERNRRTRIRDGLHALRALVPKISKMDKASILGDAIDYIGELKGEVNKLKDELKEIEEQDCRETNPEIELKTSNFKELHQCRSHPTLTKYNQGSSGFGENRNSVVQLEVNQIGKRNFLIKLFCEWKRGGFRKLMEALNSIGIQVLDANITTFKGKVLNILKVVATEGCTTKEIEGIIERAEKA